MHDSPSATVAHPLKFAETGDAPQAPSESDALVRTLHPLRNVKATLRVCVGGIELSIGELLNARRDDVLTIDRLVDEPVDILLEGSVIARGELVAVDDAYGVRLTEVPVGLKL
ncbi:FliM/FliN family flagellar motor switch protein [Paraburkholderia ferrariae]|uniref:Flagellar motor switch protein FliN n=1 Tax=Paraburkholderia ferrariae TaxID=386056 RepID=A0ABU9RMK1_9BURK